MKRAQINRSRFYWAETRVLSLSGHFLLEYSDLSSPKPHSWLSYALTISLACSDDLVKRVSHMAPALKHPADFTSLLGIAKCVTAYKVLCREF